MHVIKYPIDLNTVTDSRATGSVIISDARLLLRPAVPGQSPSDMEYDSAHAYLLLDLGNDMSPHYQWHIICQGDPTAAHELLDRVFYAYVDASCLERRCDARVRYIVDGKAVQVKGYGFEASCYTMVFNVYCGIAADQAEELIATLSAKQTDSYVVIRPDSSELGCSVQGFAVEHPDEDD
jgi:hypothetical protein